jgi:hypothetical protein
MVLGVLVLFSGGCRQPHQGWEPPLEETSTRFLQSQVDETLQFVRGAQTAIRVDPEQVEQRLDGAVRTLERMSKYYLPLLEAREHAYNAHRLLYLDAKHRAKTEIQAVEDILGSVAEHGGARILPAIEEPLDLVSEAKAAVMARSDRAPDLIKSLAVKLNYLALKGELEIPENWPPSESGGG